MHFILGRTEIGPGGQFDFFSAVIRLPYAAMWSSQGFFFTEHYIPFVFFENGLIFRELLERRLRFK